MKPLLEGLNTGVFKKLVRRLRLESFLIAILFTGLLGGCSNSETTEKTAEPTPKTVDAILKLDNLWILTNYKSSVYIAELENVGDKPIKAFVAEWVILDDLDKIIASSTIEYTSDTQYSPSSKEQSTPGHLILKGEHICMQTMSIPSLSEQEAEMMKATGIGTSAYSKEQIRTRVLMGMGELPQEALDEKRVTKKIRFSLEKVVFAD